MAQGLIARFDGNINILAISCVYLCSSESLLLMSDSVDGGCTSQISVGKFKLQNIDLNNYLKVEDSGNGMRVAGGSRPDPPGTSCFIRVFQDLN